MKRRLFSIIVCFFMVIGIILPYDTAYAEEGYKALVEASEILNEHLMIFGTFDSKVLYDLCITEGTELYDYVYWENEDENLPFDNYQVFATNPNSEILMFKVDSDQYKGTVYLSVGIMGYNDIALPMLMLGGEGNFDKKVSKIIINTTEKYEIHFKTNNEFNVVEDGSFMSVCSNLGEYGIDIIEQIASNKMQFTIDILFSNKKTISINSTPTTSNETNPFYWLNQALKESKYLDNEGNVQMQFEELFLGMNKQKGMPIVKCLTCKDEAKEMRAPYGLRMTDTGDVGLELREPWIKVGVENTTKNKTVDGFDLIIYGKDVYGEPIEINGDQGRLQYKTIIKDILPNRKYMTPKIYVLGYRDVKTIHAALRRIHFTDGTKYEVPLRDMIFTEYQITY